MKKILSIGVLLTVLSFLGISKSFALTFDQAFSQVGKKPMVVLIYANWADGYENCLQQFRTVKASLGGVYNFVELDIAQKDAKYSAFDMLVIRYLQAINLNEHVHGGDNALIGSLWLKLYWLAKDSGDGKFAKYCSSKAIDRKNCVFSVEFISKIYK